MLLAGSSPSAAVAPPVDETRMAGWLSLVAGCCRPRRAVTDRGFPSMLSIPILAKWHPIQAERQRGRIQCKYAMRACVYIFLSHFIQEKRVLYSNLRAKKSDPCEDTRINSNYFYFITKWKKNL